MKFHQHHLAYCTNIHPAETWQETLAALKEHTLTVRNKLVTAGNLATGDMYAIGLRLSALAANELLQGDHLEKFKLWLAEEHCYVFTINGFPYGAFHHTRVKENVYKPDWTCPSRLEYTKQLMHIIAEICPAESGGSVSTLPGSFKEFNASEQEIFKHLYAQACYTGELSARHNKDLHLGLEPEPLGHFENTEETLAFFQRFFDWAETNGNDSELIKKHIGVNYDTCHFALEFDECHTSLQAFADAGIRISKIHLSNALEIKADCPQAIEAIRCFNEPTYLHQFMLRSPDGSILRFRDLPEFFSSNTIISDNSVARIHFHIPLYQQPAPPLGSTREFAEKTLEFLKLHPEICPHLEMETYTWGVLPDQMQKPIVDQLVEEYQWTLKHG